MIEELKIANNGQWTLEKAQMSGTRKTRRKIGSAPKTADDKKIDSKLKALQDEVKSGKKPSKHEYQTHTPVKVKHHDEAPTKHIATLPGGGKVHHHADSINAEGHHAKDNYTIEHPKGSYKGWYDRKGKHLSASPHAGDNEDDSGFSPKHANTPEVKTHIADAEKAIRTHIKQNTKT